MGNRLPEPYDPSPDVPYWPPPKSKAPVYPEGRDEGARTMAQQGVPLPTAYGTVKLPLLVIEKLTPIQQDPPAWVGSTNYSKGYLAQNGGNVYIVTSGGIGPSAASGGPTGTGTGITDNLVIWDYVQQLPCPTYYQRFLAALCEGQAQAALTLWWDKEAIPAVNGTLLARVMEVKLGPDAGGQTLLGVFDSSGYQHTVVVQPLASAIGMPSGTKKELPAAAVELQSVMFGSGVADVNPGDIVNDILTHARRGCVWPGSRVDASITGTTAGGYRVYCDAAGFRFSMVFDKQRPARDWIADILAATNSEAVWSGGKLKIVPLGDQNIAAPVYGATGYVSANTVQYNLGAGDFQRASWQRRKDPDCFNTWPVQYVNRANNYSTVVEQSPDALDVERRGVPMVAQTVALPVIFPDGKAPIMLSGILTQRSLSNRNTYHIEGVPWRYILTEPTDVITLTDPVSGLSLQPMRIVEWEEGPDGETLTLICEDYGAAVQAALSYTPQAGDGAKDNAPATLASAPALAGVVTTADRNVKVGPYVFSSAWRRVLQALDGDAVSQGGSGITFYRGQNDPTVRGGAAIMTDGLGERVEISSYATVRTFNASFGGGNITSYPLQIIIRPRANTDNLDAMRLMQIELFSSAGTSLGFQWITLSDRRYSVPATPADNNNTIAIKTVLWVTDAGYTAYGGAPNHFNGYARVFLFNGYGQSDGRDYGQAPNSTAVWAAGATIPGAGSPPTGGGGGGSPYCPTPDSRILLPGGRTIAAGDLVDGMEVVGFSERDATHELVGTVRYVSHELAQMLYALRLADGRVLRCSKNHRLCSVKRGWMTVQDLEPGEQLVARTDSIVDKVIADGPGRVVGFVVEGPHTYFTDDVLSHNTKPSLP